MYNFNMNNLSLKIKKTVIKKFLKELNKKIKSFYFDLNVLSCLSKRKIYKLLKIAYQVDGIKIDKKELKEYAYILSKINSHKLNKKDVNFLFKQITTTDITKHINKISYDFINIAELLKNNSIFPNKFFNYIHKRIYLFFSVIRV